MTELTPVRDAETLAETDPREFPVRRSSIFLWTLGSVMWLVVLGSVWGIWYKQREAHRQLLAQQEVEPQQGVPMENILVPVDQDGPKEQPQDLWDAKGIEDFTLISSEKKEVTKKDLLGKPWVVQFMFTKCQGTCPAIIAEMRELYAN